VARGARHAPRPDVITHLTIQVVMATTCRYFAKELCVVFPWQPPHWYWHAANVTGYVFHAAEGPRQSSLIAEAG